MIIIGICDGEQTIRSLLASYVERYRSETDAEIQLLSYSTGEKLLKNYMLDLDLIFLEIPLRKVSGLKIAEYIKDNYRTQFYIKDYVLRQVCETEYWYSRTGVSSRTEPIRN